jgi:four helix bundle protein
MAKGDDLEERFVKMASDVILLCKQMPKDDGGSHLAGQLVRSGTAPAPNYAEARGAESGRDFLHKLRIVQKELNETEIWLRVMITAGFATEQSLHHLCEEVKSLARIITASIRTLKERGVGKEAK